MEVRVHTQPQGHGVVGEPPSRVAGRV